MTRHGSDGPSVALWATHIGRPLSAMAQWLDNVDRQMRQAAAAGASILVLPEYCTEQWLTFAPADLALDGEIAWLAERAPEAMAELISLPRRHGIALVAGTRSRGWPAPARVVLFRGIGIGHGHHRLVALAGHVARAHAADLQALRVGFLQALERRRVVVGAGAL